jgi:hypothetical protein
MPQVGRKAMFLMVLLVMCIAEVAGALIILGFDLEDLSAGSSVEQTVAGYFVLVAILIILLCASIGVA